MKDLNNNGSPAARGWIKPLEKFNCYLHVAALGEYQVSLFPGQQPRRLSELGLGEVPRKVLAVRRGQREDPQQKDAYVETEDIEEKLPAGEMREAVPHGGYVCVCKMRRNKAVSRRYVPLVIPGNKCVQVSGGLPEKPHLRNETISSHREVSSVS